MSKKVLVPVIAVVITIFVLLAFHQPRNETIIVFCAGSLKIPLEQVAENYEDETGVKVYIEASGSVEAVRKITDLGRKADIVAVADYRLIPGFLVPKYSKWYIGFATNEVVLVYTDKSKYHEELESNPSRWYEILARSDVRYGFSDPNKDPCGYRSVGIIVLAGLYYNNMGIPEKLLFNKTNISYEVVNNTYHVYVKPAIEINSGDLVIRPKSVDLIALLEAGDLDYAFEYKSVAIQHGLKYIELPDEINLGNPDYKDYYARVIVHILVGTDNEKELTMAPIVYGVTIPVNAPHYDKAVEYVKLLLSDKGREVFENLGQNFLDKPIVYGDVPEEIREVIGG